jgi:hypothetical protein
VFVTRWIENVKKGHVKELVELTKAMPDYGVPPPPHGVRVYSGGAFSDWDVVIYETEYENWEEYHAYMKEFYASSQGLEWLEEHRKHIERGGHGEQWTVDQVY